MPRKRRPAPKFKVGDWAILNTGMPFPPHVLILEDRGVIGQPRSQRYRGRYSTDPPDFTGTEFKEAYLIPADPPPPDEF